MTGFRFMSKLRRSRVAGFTLVEVLVSLVVGTLIVGGVMGMLGSSMKYRQRVADKIVEWPVLEAAAQQILADPESYLDSDVTLEQMPGKPVVSAQWTQVELLDQGPEGSQIVTERSLVRVRLSYRKSRLRLSFVYSPEAVPE